METFFELRIAVPQRCFRVYAEFAPNVYRREQDVTKFILNKFQIDFA